MRNHYHVAFLLGCCTRPVIEPWVDWKRSRNARSLLGTAANSSVLACNPHTRGSRWLRSWKAIKEREAHTVSLVTTTANLKALSMVHITQKFYVRSRRYCKVQYTENRDDWCSLQLIFSCDINPNQLLEQPTSWREWRETVNITITICYAEETLWKTHRNLLTNPAWNNPEPSVTFPSCSIFVLNLP